LIKSGSKIKAAMPNVQERVLVTESERFVPLMSMIIKTVSLKGISQGVTQQKAKSSDSPEQTRSGAEV
jgi:hypothetical protein